MDDSHPKESGHLTFFLPSIALPACLRLWRVLRIDGLGRSHFRLIFGSEQVSVGDRLARAGARHEVPEGDAELRAADGGVEEVAERPLVAEAADAVQVGEDEDRHRYHRNRRGVNAVHIRLRRSCREWTSKDDNLQRLERKIVRQTAAYPCRAGTSGRRHSNPGSGAELEWSCVQAHKNTQVGENRSQAPGFPK